MIIKDKRTRLIPSMMDPANADTWAEGPPRGWVPVNIEPQEEVIRWMHVGTDFSPDEPFFNQSIRLLRAKSPPPVECETELTALEARKAASLVPPTPSGIIVHVSRCGSTVLTNALRAADNAIVLSEAAPIDSMLSWAAHPTSRRSVLFNRFLPQVVRVFSQYRGVAERQVVIKCGIGGALAMPALRAIWPTVPFVVLIRRPEEVIAANLRRPSAYLIDWYLQPARCWFGTPPAEVRGAGVEEYFAWILGRVYNETFNSLDSYCKVIDYEELGPSVARRVGDIFQLRLSADAASGMDAAFRVNAKNQRRPFEPDSEAKRKAVSALTRAAVERWIESSYSEMRQR